MGLCWLWIWSLMLVVFNDVGFISIIVAYFVVIVSHSSNDLPTQLI